MQTTRFLAWAPFGRPRLARSAWDTVWSVSDRRQQNACTTVSTNTCRSHKRQRRGRGTERERERIGGKANGQQHKERNRASNQTKTSRACMRLSFPVNQERKQRSLSLTTPVSRTGSPSPFPSHPPRSSFPCPFVCLWGWRRKGDQWRHAATIKTRTGEAQRPHCRDGAEREKPTREEKDTKRRRTRQGDRRRTPSEAQHHHM